MASRRSCKLSPDLFCYVCGYYVGPKMVKRQIKMDTKYSTAYAAYFGMAMGDQDKEWAPHFICGTCRSILEGWLRGTRKGMPFAIPRIWREPTNHLNDCYFCLVDVSKAKSVKGRKNIEYPCLPSSIAPVPHSNELPIPIPPVSPITDMEISSDEDNSEMFHEDSTKTPHFPNQEELNDLVRDLSLTKSNAELLASRLNEWNLLDSSCKTSSYRNRHIIYASFFKFCDSHSLCYCYNVKGLMDEIGFEYINSDWRLFIDSSTRSLKGVLLHNGNEYPSIPVAHSVQMNEDYENVKYLLHMINYEDHQWEVCGDFKMLAFLLGMQGGYTKYSCFLCLWDSRADAEHYIKKDWPPRNALIPGSYNIKQNALIKWDKILLPPLHIKLGLIKQYVKAMDSDSDALQYIRSMFPKLSEAKVKGGIFVGPQIRRMLASKDLEERMTPTEKNAWNAFRHVVHGFLGNNRSKNYKTLVEDLINQFETHGCRMSIKMHYMHSHLDFFKENLGDVSEEHGERFHQDIQTMEKRYQGRWDEAMMGDYIWSLVRENSQEHKRKSRCNTHF